MLWDYIGKVLAQAFSPALRLIDGMQVIVASAIPAAGIALGVEITPDSGPRALAYIGAVSIALVGIRLLCAPYFIWQLQEERIVELDSELAKPEFLVRQFLAELQAQQRAEAIGHIHNLAAGAYAGGDKERQINDAFMATLEHSTRAGLPVEFGIYLSGFATYCQNYVPDEKSLTAISPYSYSEHYIRFLSGSVTFEVMKAGLPPVLQSAEQKAALAAITAGAPEP